MRQKTIIMIKNLRLFTLLLIILGTGIVLKGQDIHFTQFDFSPLTLNPAKTGDFNGTFRVSAIYRDQWRIAGGQGIFTTPAITYDMPLFSVGERSWISVGGMVYSDGTGSANLRTTSFIGSVAFHLSLDKNQRNVLSLGVSSGMLQKRLKNVSSLLFEDEITGGTSSLDVNNVNEMGKGQVDYNAGLMFKSKLTQTSDMEIGFSVGHLSRPNVGVLNSGGSRVPMIFRLYGQSNIGISESFSVTPRAIINYIETNNSQNISAQLLGNFILNQDAGTKVSVGGGYRIADALQVIGGLEIRNLRIGLAYDLRTSVFSNTGGSFEIAASYIAKIYKRPKVNPTVLCPRL